MIACPCARALLPCATRGTRRVTACRISDCPRCGLGRDVVLLARQFGDRLDRDEQAVGQPDVGWGGTGRRRIGHVAGVDLVEPGEVLDIGVEDRCLDHVGHGRAGGAEHGSEVDQRLVGLGLDALGGSFPSRDRSRPCLSRRQSRRPRSPGCTARALLGPHRSTLPLSSSAASCGGWPRSVVEDPSGPVPAPRSTNCRNRRAAARDTRHSLALYASGAGDPLSIRAGAMR
jgi:hypothetical protein